MGNVWWHLNSRSKWFFLSALVKDLSANTHEVKKSTVQDASSGVKLHEIESRFHTFLRNEPGKVNFSEV